MKLPDITRFLLLILVHTCKHVRKMHCRHLWWNFQPSDLFGEAVLERETVHKSCSLDPLNAPAAQVIWLAGCTAAPNESRLCFGDHCKFLLEASSWNQVWKASKHLRALVFWIFRCRVKCCCPTQCDWLPLLLPYYGSTAGVTDCDWMIMDLINN